MSEERTWRTMQLVEARESCGAWDEELNTCTDDYPEDCPFRAECQSLAEADEEEEATAESED